MINGPNTLTLLRILAVPAIVVILLVPFSGHEVVAFGLFVLASLTDMVDGIWARRRNLVTEFGILLDPTADKLLIASTLICLVGLRVVPAWMAVIIIGREIAVSGFRAVASAKGIHIPASALGKLKMGLETWVTAALVLGPGLLGRFFVVARIGLWLVVAAAAGSALEYFVRFGGPVLRPAAPTGSPAPSPATPGPRRSRTPEESASRG